MHLDHVTQIFKDAQIEVENKSAKQGVAVFQLAQKNRTKAFEVLKKNNCVLEGSLSSGTSALTAQLYFSLDLNFEFYVVFQ